MAIKPLLSFMFSTWGLLRLSAKSYVKQNRSFLLDAANGSSEPTLLNAAPGSNDR